MCSGNSNFHFVWLYLYVVDKLVLSEIGRKIESKLLPILMVLPEVYRLIFISTMQNAQDSKFSTSE